MMNATKDVTAITGTLSVEPQSADKQLFGTSKLYLDKCEHLIAEKKWFEVLQMCNAFLIEFPISLNINDKNTAKYANFRHFAGVMLSNNHNYDSVINLLSIRRDMQEFTSTYFKSIDKKGVHIPNPKVKKEEILFIHSFCTSLYNMVIASFED